MPLIGDEGRDFFMERCVNVRTPPLDRDRPVGVADVRFQLPEIEKSEMIKKRLAKQALHFGDEVVP